MSFPKPNSAQEIIHPFLLLQGYINGVVLKADFVNSTDDLESLTDLTETVEIGKTYCFQIWLRVNDSNGEGLQVDLNGGSATVSSIWVTYEIKDVSFSFLKHAAALDALASMVSLEGGHGLVEVRGSFTASANGTFIPRVAQAAHDAGSLTVLRGSSMILREIS